MNPFHLAILAMDRVFFEGDCLSMTVPLYDGSLGIMAHHTPMTAEIVDGEVTYTTADGEQMLCAVTQGMITVSDNTVKLLCESALGPDEINEADETAAAQSAAAALRLKQSHKDFVLSRMAFARASNNLRVKQHKSMNQ